MTQTLFEFNKSNYHHCQSAYRGEKNQEYYLGNYTIESAPTIEVSAEKKSAGPCSLIYLKSNTRLLFNRNWTHIREDSTDVTVLWFVKRGCLRIRHQHGEYAVQEGDLALTKSRWPFSIECEVDDAKRHEVLHMVVPTYLFNSHMADEIQPVFTMDGNQSEFSIADKILTLLMRDKEELSERVIHHLLESALITLTSGLRKRADIRLFREKISEMRWSDVLRHIDLNLSRPDLGLQMIADACGISERHLSRLCKENGTQFSSLIWSKRINIAKESLAAENLARVSIAEIAYRIGFKSPAHFSRMFKSVFKVTPREYRSRFLNSQALENGSCLIGNQEATLQ